MKPVGRKEVSIGGMYGRYLSLVLVFVGFIGCQGISSLPPPEVTSRLSSTEPIWQHLQVRRQSYENLKGLAQVQVRLDKRGGILDNVVVALDQFKRARLEGIGPFGQPMFLLIAFGERFSLYLPQEFRVVEGATTANPLERLFGIPIDLKVLRYVLIGDLPFAVWPASEPLKFSKGENLYVWEGQVPPEPWHYRVWIDPYRLLPVRFAILGTASEVILQVEYEDFRQLPGLTLPFMIRLSQPGSKRSMSWAYQEVQLNQGVPSSLFQVHVPPGIERFQLN